MQNTNPTEPIEPCTITYGVDLSTGPRTTGLVAIEWAGGQPGVVVEAHVRVTREDLIERIACSEEGRSGRWRHARGTRRRLRFKSG